MLLSDGFNGRKYVIEKMEVDTLSKNLLRKMKVERGSIVKIVRKHHFYSTIIEVDQTRIALDAKLVRKIWVVPYV